MFRSLKTIVREFYLYLTKVIFMLKYSVNITSFYIHIYIYLCMCVCLVMWQHVIELHAATSPNIYKMTSFYRVF